MNLKLVVTSLILFVSLGTFGQDTWSGLSAKQKIKLAKKEQKAAKKDSEYLKLMDEALTFFQAKEYENARSKYEAAHLRRPDNVYPMVMLDDIEIAIANEEEELIVEEEIIQEEIIEEEIVEEETIIASTVKPELAEENPSINPKQEEKESIEVPKDAEIEIVEQQKPTLQPERKVIIKQEPKVYLEDGTFINDFKEGSANVKQIDIVLKGVKTSYRKVSHSWGAIYYFKNEDSITKEEWEKVYLEATKD